MIRFDEFHMKKMHVVLLHYSSKLDCVGINISP